MRIVIVTGIALLLVSMPAAGATWAGDDETPTAADLFRAERRARDIARRLELPARPTPGWKHGGEGWMRPLVPGAEAAGSPHRGSGTQASP